MVTHLFDRCVTVKPTAALDFRGKGYTCYTSFAISDVFLRKKIEKKEIKKIYK